MINCPSQMFNNTMKSQLSWLQASFPFRGDMCRTHCSQDLTRVTVGITLLRFN